MHDKKTAPKNIFDGIKPAPYSDILSLAGNIIMNQGTKKHNKIIFLYFPLYFQIKYIKPITNIINIGGDNNSSHNPIVVILKLSKLNIETVPVIGSYKIFSMMENRK